MPYGNISKEEVVWRPTPEYVERSHLKTFMDRHDLGSLEELQTRASDDVAWFTESVIDYLDIQFQHPFSQVVNVDDGIQFPA